MTSERKCAVCGLDWRVAPVWTNSKSPLRPPLCSEHLLQAKLGECPQSVTELRAVLDAADLVASAHMVSHQDN
jgi:hypothetical protein